VLFTPYRRDLGFARSCDQGDLPRAARGGGAGPIAMAILDHDPKTYVSSLQVRVHPERLACHFGGRFWRSKIDQKDFVKQKLIGAAAQFVEFELRPPASSAQFSDALIVLWTPSAMWVRPTRVASCDARTRSAHGSRVLGSVGRRGEPLLLSCEHVLKERDKGATLYVPGAEGPVDHDGRR